jgi:hypothetical protein
MALTDGGFIFGGDTGMSYEQLKQRRAIAAALASRQKGFPKTKGEGMTYLGDSIAEALTDLGLYRREQAQRAVDKKAMGGPQGEYKEPIDQPVVGPKSANPPPEEKTAIVDKPVTPAPAQPPDLTGWPTVAPVEPWPVSETDTGAPTFNERFAAVSEPQPDVTPVQTVSVPPPVQTASASPQDTSMFFSPQMEASLRGGSVPPVEAMMALKEVQPAAQTAQLPPDQVTLPTETPDIPLPMGNPRTTGGVRATMEAVASRGGMTPNAIAGLERNVRDESNFNYNLRHPDQPGFSGEARFAHGLYQEGGDEWNNFVKWIDQNHPGSDWRDPKLQTQYTVERLQDPSRADYNRTFAGMNAAPNSGVAADQFLRGYLKPAAEHLATRSASYLSGGGGPTYASRDIQPGGEGGAQTAGARVAGGGRTGGAPAPDELAAQRDAVTLALMNQQAQQPPTQEDAVADNRLQDVVGRRPGSPFFAPTAALGRAGVATDAPTTGLSPMGALGGSGVDQSVEARRNAISDALQNQQPTAPAVPQPDPTQAGTSPSPTTASLPPTSPSVISSDVVTAPPMGATAQASIPLAPPVGYGGTMAQAPVTPRPTGVPVGVRPVEPAPTDQGIRPIPKPPAFPDPGPEPTLGSVIPQNVVREMTHWRGVMANPAVSDTVRKYADERYKELHGQAQDLFNKKWGIWKDAYEKKREYDLGDPQRNLALEQSVLSAEKSRRELEGEGAVRVSNEELAQLFPRGLPAGVEVYRTRRGELKEIKGPQTVTVDQRGENEFAKVTNKALGEHFVKTFEDGTNAANDLETITELRQRNADVRTGAAATVQQALGRFGINTEGLSEIQAFHSLLQRLTPQQRVPGTGATSDFEGRMFRESLPLLMNTPQGNALIMDTMERLAKNKLDRADIAGQVISGALTPQDGVKKMYALQLEARAHSDRVKAFVEEQQKTGTTTTKPSEYPPGTIRRSPDGTRRQEMQPDGTWKDLTGG